MTPEQLFADVLAAEPGRPFITYYDEATGERSELSAKSLANWVAKTHHLLGTELGLGAGDRALLDLPAHWISLPPLLGVLTAGLEIVDDPSDADVAFVEPATIARAAGVPDLYAVAPASAAVGFGDAVPAGVNDFVTAVRPQEDKWPGVRFGAGPDGL
ncbi:MAG: TIGR03089 family protein, partial [Jatrophihabitantaceae bacterium]